MADLSAPRPALRRPAQRQNIAVSWNGHVVDWTGPVENTYEVNHNCGKWTWEDGNYCVNCGGKL